MGAVIVQVGLHEIGVSMLDRAHFPVDARLAGDDVVRDAADQGAGVDRRPGRVEAAVGGGAGLELFLEVEQPGDVAHGIFHRVHAAVRA